MRRLISTCLAPACLLSIAAVRTPVRFCSRDTSGLTPLQRRIAARLARGPLPPMNVVVEGPNELERQLPPDIEEAHRHAVDAGEETYTDPKTHLTVFTRVAHINKGRCCGCKCRHCPYGHVNVPTNKMSAKASVSSSTSDRATAEVCDAPPPTPPTGAGSAKNGQPLRKSGVYTRGGDKGTSSLFTGERRSKADLVFQALGSIDELNSHVGLSRAFLVDDKRLEGTDVVTLLVRTLEDVQRRLLHCGAMFATPPTDADGSNAPLPHDPLDWTRDVERTIDVLDASLPPLTSFILPGGGAPSAQLHVCRSTCRRAERCVVELMQRDAEYQHSKAREAAAYINRLSDFFFVAARAASDVTQEVSWDKHSS